MLRNIDVDCEYEAINAEVIVQGDLSEKTSLTRRTQTRRRY